MPKHEVKPTSLVRKRKKLLQQFKEKLTRKERERAKKDPHSKRDPRWCGITIHVATNCSYSCRYCYIKDMDFKFKHPVPSSLNGKELVFALLNNRSFLPGKGGTLIAMGAVSDPFLVPEKNFAFLKELSKLGNPIQFATKSFLSVDMSERIKRISRRKSEISPLITIVTLSHASVLEPNAPRPRKRFETIKNLANAGLQPVLFLRPIIPKINKKEARLIMKKAKKAGAIGVVIGSFRVTRNILDRLEKIGLPTSEVMKRMEKIDDKQRSMTLLERKKLMKKAREIGLIPWRTTCCPNSFQSGIPCPSTCFLTKLCTNCPNKCSFPEDVPQKLNVERALNYLRIRGEVNGKTVIIHEPHAPKMLVRNLSRRKPTTV